MARVVVAPPARTACEPCHRARTCSHAFASWHAWTCKLCLSSQHSTTQQRSTTWPRYHVHTHLLHDLHTKQGERKSAIHGCCENGSSGHGLAAWHAPPLCFAFSATILCAEVLHTVRLRRRLCCLAVLLWQASPPVLRKSSRLAGISPAYATWKKQGVLPLLLPLHGRQTERWRLRWTPFGCALKGMPRKHRRCLAHVVVATRLAATPLNSSCQPDPTPRGHLCQVRLWGVWACSHMLPWQRWP